VGVFAAIRAHHTRPVRCEAVSEKRYLFTPGPTPVPPEVLAVLAEPIVHHRGADFRPVYARCLERLKQVCRTSSDVLLFTASGTGAMESAVANLCSPGDRVIVVSAGAFGERWIDVAERYGCEVAALRYEWGEVPQASDLAATLAATDGVRAVLLTHSETSTGVVCDLRAFAEAVRPSGAHVVVDAVSSLGAVPVEMDAWGIDVVCSGSQKALMTPPGLAVAAVSDAVWEQEGRASSPRFYFDWERTRKAQEALDAPFTPAVSLVRALDVALGLLLEEGLEAAFERHIRLGRACRAGLKAMGLELFSPDDDSSAVVTAGKTPSGVDASALVSLLRERHGVQLAGGHGPLKSTVFRIGHIGYYDVFDIVTALAGVELGLVELGADVERGAAVSRALEAFEGVESRISGASAGFARRRAE
jgi:serine---pyruvate transaminase